MIVNLNDISQLTIDREGDIIAYIDNDPEEYIINSGRLNEKSVLPNLYIYRHEYDTKKLFVDLSKSKKLETVYINKQLLNKKNIKLFNKIKTIYASNIPKEDLKNIFPNHKISKSEYDNVLTLFREKTKHCCKKDNCYVKPRNGKFCSKHKN